MQTFYRYFFLFHLFVFSPSIYCMESVDQSSVDSSQISPAIHKFMVDLGIDQDSAVCKLFINRLKCPPLQYMDPKHIYEAKQSNPALAVPYSRATAFLTNFAQQTIFDLKEKKDEENAIKYAEYYGAIPALDAVSNYFINQGNTHKAVEIMRQASFWQEFGTLCNMNAGNDSSSFAFNYTVANLIKIAPQLLSHQPAKVYKNIVKELKAWLDTKAQGDNLNAWTHMVQISLIPQLYDEQSAIHAMTEILQIINDENRCLEFIVGNKLKQGLELLAKNNHSLAHALLIRLYYHENDWDAIIAYAKKSAAKPSSELYIIGMVAHVMRAIAQPNDEQCNTELRLVAEWLTREIGEHYADPLVKLFLSHLPPHSIDKIEEFALKKPNRYAELLLGYLCAVQKERLSDASTHFLKATTLGTAVEKMLGNDLARWITINIVIHDSRGEKEEDLAFDWCLEIAAADTPYKQEAHDLLLNMGATNIAAKIRMLMQLINEDPENQFLETLNSIHNNELSRQKFLNYCQRPTIQEKISTLRNSDNCLIQKRAEQLGAYLAFATSCLSSTGKDQQWQMLNQTDFLKTLNIFAVHAHYQIPVLYTEKEQSILGMLAQLMHAVYSSENHDLFAKELHKLTIWLTTEIGIQCHSETVLFLLNNCPLFLLEKIKNFAHDSNNLDAHIVLGYLAATDKERSKEAYEYFAECAKEGNDFAKWMAITIVREHGLSDQEEQALDWCLEIASMMSSRYKKPAHDLLLKMSEEKNHKASIRLLMLLIVDGPNNCFARVINALRDNESKMKDLINFFKKSENKEKIKQYKTWKDQNVQARVNLLVGYIILDHAVRMPMEETSKAVEFGLEAFRNAEYAVDHKCGSNEDLAKFSMAIGDFYLPQHHYKEVAQWYQKALEYKKNPVVELLWANSILLIVDADKKGILETGVNKTELEKALKIMEHSAQSGNEEHQLLFVSIYAHGYYGRQPDFAKAFKYLHTVFANHSDDPDIAVRLINLLCEARNNKQPLDFAHDYEKIYQLCELACQNPAYRTIAIKGERAIAAYRTNRIEEADAFFNEFKAGNQYEYLNRLTFNRALSLIKKSLQETEDDKKMAILAEASDLFINWFWNYFYDPQERESEMSDCTAEDAQLIKKVLQEYSSRPDTDVFNAVINLLALTQNHDTLFKNKKRREAALSALIKVADAREFCSCLALSYYYREGQIVKQNRDKAFEYLKIILEESKSANCLLAAINQIDHFIDADRDISVRVLYYMVEKLLSENFQTVLLQPKDIPEEKEAEKKRAQTLALHFFKEADTLLVNQFRQLISTGLDKSATEAVKKLADSGNLEACCALAIHMRNMVGISRLGPKDQHRPLQYTHDSLVYMQQAYDAHLIEQKDIIAAYLAEADICLLSDLSLAGVFIAKALKVDPNNLFAKSLYAHYLLLSQGNHEGASVKRMKGLALMQSLADEAKYPYAQYIMGALYGNFGIHHLDGLVPLDPEKARAYLELAKPTIPAAEGLLEQLATDPNKKSVESMPRANVRKHSQTGADEMIFRTTLKKHVDLFNAATRWQDRTDQSRRIAELYANHDATLNNCFLWLHKIIDDQDSPAHWKSICAVDAVKFCLEREQEKYTLQSVDWIKIALKYGMVNSNGEFMYGAGDPVMQVIKELSQNSANHSILNDLMRAIKKAKAQQTETAIQPTEAKIQPPQATSQLTDATTQNIPLPSEVLSETVIESKQTGQESTSATPVPDEQRPLEAPDENAEIPLINRVTDLPVLSASELTRVINNAGNLMAPGIFKALTLAHDKKIIVLSDTHGAGDRFIGCLNDMRKEGYFTKENPWKLKDDYLLILTGDIADRGPDGIDCWRLASKLVENNPGGMLILRGNHETATIASYYGLFDEIRARYPRALCDITARKQIVESFLSLFSKLPQLLLLGIRNRDNRVLFFHISHGGCDKRIAPESILALKAESMLHQGALISKTDADMKIDQSEHEFSPDNNGLNWSDFVKQLEDNQKFQWGRLRSGAQGYEITPEGAREVLESYSQPEAPMLCYVRGHYHLSGCLSKFNASTGNWDRLNTREIIEPNSIYTLMCLPPDMITNDGATPQAGYSVIEFNQQDQLTITPHIVDVP